MSFLKRFLMPLGIFLAASCISISVYQQPQPKPPLTMDVLVDSVRLTRPVLPPPPTKKPTTPTFIYLASIIEEESARAGVDPSLVRAIIKHESGGDSLAVNEADPSYGLGQVMPKWWQHAFVEECGSEATPETLLYARINVCYTAHIIAHAWNKFDGNRSAVISYYNTGTPHRGIHNGYNEAVESHLSADG